MAKLRAAWQEARADKSPGLDPHEVFERLHRKYRAMIVYNSALKRAD